MFISVETAKSCIDYLLLQMTALGLSQQLERKTSSRYFSYEMKLLLIGSAVVFEVGQLMVKGICTLMVKERAN